MHSLVRVRVTGSRVKGLRQVKGRQYSRGQERIDKKSDRKAVPSVRLGYRVSIKIEFLLTSLDFAIPDRKFFDILRFLYYFLIIVR